MNFLDRRTKKDFMNEAIYWLTRPWVVVFAITFLLTPCSKIAEALDSGADFLNIGVGARPSAMGSAFTAVSNDANSIYYNPAGLAAMQKREVSFMHADWVLGEKYDFAAMAIPFGKVSAGISAAKMDHGEIQGRSSNRSSLGGFEARDSVFSIALAQTVGNASSIGLGLKYLTSSIADYSASAFAFDAGFLHKIDGMPVSVGIAVQNMGKGLKFINRRDSLPLSVKFGAAARVFKSVNLAVDFKRLINEKENSFSIGTEYNLLGNMFLRGGYNAKILNAHDASENLSGISGGVGFNLSNLQIDYAFSPFGDIDTTKKLSLSMKF
ncbi:MAG: PorV/PorQ family protein [Elusimicrobia bacterium]|nr:PorV/PorQ family protein [Elusimicrobiota bacterium]